ncbi:lipase [Streptomyces sp. A7024]|uniref:Lipase n=1 Tax=Streptomyces coryli TaxID=1128680 RepID=A0A6G4TYK6_9ACTN|nr:lipase family protein [Streptomyces coryli]NGN64974.1 lipase [Streptomyces coryli]
MPGMRHRLLARAGTVLGAAGIVAALTVAVPAAVAEEDFYTPPSPLPAGANGDVLKSQQATYNNAKATRIMYLSRSAKNKPIPVTGSVIVPNAPWTGPGDRPIVAYAPFTAGLGDQCAPSKGLTGQGSGDPAGGFQGSYVDALLAKGFAVAQTDYEGLGTPGEHTYVMRLSEAHTVLDALRAATRLPGTGLAKKAPLGIAGYSEGGGAAASAAELASSYAPELNIKGATPGAAPADKAVLAKSLDGGLYVAFLGYALVGIDTAYPESKILTDLANDKGKEFFEAARSTCTGDAVSKYMFTRTSSLTKDGRPVSAYLGQAPFDKIVAENRIGQAKPSMPVLVEHSIFDDVIPYDTGKQMAKDWCAKGANTEFRTLLGTPLVGGHATAMPDAVRDSAAWLDDRFRGKQTTGNCGKF